MYNSQVGISSCYEHPSLKSEKINKDQQISNLMDKILPKPSDFEIRVKTVLVKVSLLGLKVNTNLCAKSLKENTIMRKLENVLLNILPNIY